MPAGSSQTQVTCYRHPKRPAPLACSRCGRPICLEDAVDAPVGYLCPECARHPGNVRRATRRVGNAQDARATIVLVALIGLVYVAQLTTPELVQRGSLWGPAIALKGEWWRIVTSAFLHDQSFILHVLFNGYLLYQLGRLLEPELGSARFMALFSAGLFGGSAGVLLLSWGTPTIGASGAVFGLMGAALVLLRRRGLNPFKTSIGGLVIINLVFTFVVPGISWAGHLGGLTAGALAAVPLVSRRDGRDLAAIWAIAGVLAVAALYFGVNGPVL